MAGAGIPMAWIARSHAGTGEKPAAAMIVAQKARESTSALREATETTRGEAFAARATSRERLCCSREARREASCLSALEGPRGFRTPEGFAGSFPKVLDVLMEALWESLCTFLWGIQETTQGLGARGQRARTWSLTADEVR